MAFRVVGAVLALIAAALLTVSIVTTAWWQGPPEMGGKVYHRKNVHIGLVQSRGCDISDDVESNCTGLSVGTAFTLVTVIELVAVGTLALGLVGLGITALLASERKRVFSKIALGAAGAGAIIAIGLLLQAPEIEGKAVGIPIGYGIYLFFVGTGLGIAAGIVALQPTRSKPAPKWSSHVQSTPQPPPPVDVLALLQEDALRPSSLGPEPMMGRPPAPPSPGGMLAGPSGPLAPVQAQPLFSTAPQLRPLYEANPTQGGTGGYVPAMSPPPALPPRGPTPISHAAVNALAGRPTPPPMAATARPKTLPPPIRSKPLSVAPPIPPLPRPAARPIGGTTPPRSQPTIASAAVPPPPGLPQTLAGILPTNLNPKLPIRADTDPSEQFETIEHERATNDSGFDAAATVARDSGQQRATSEPMDEQSVSLFHIGVGDNTSPSVPFEQPTAESRSFSSEVSTSTDLDDAEDNEASEDDDLDDAVATRAREKIELGHASTDMDLPTTAELVERVAEPAPLVAKLPITTASATLPPPTAAQAATSGPSPACPQCEAPMAWVEEHLRFYCKSCRMYF